MAILPKWFSNLRGTLEAFFGTSGGFEGSEIDTPVTDPVTGKRWIYPKDDGWYEKDSEGTETKIGASAEISSVKETITQADHTFVAGNAVRQGSSAFELAQADDADTSDVYGVVESVDGDDFVVVLEGLITGLSGGTKGSTGFLSADTAGAITTTDPSIADPTCVSKPILIYTGTTTARVQIERGALQGEEVPDEGVANVQLSIVDTSTFMLLGLAGTNRSITVNGETVVVVIEEIETDSADHYIISGTTSVSLSTALDSYTGNGSDGNAYNAYGLHHVYVCNSNACWNFLISGSDYYDRRGSIILSPNGPTSGGYLAATGDGTNARHVGWVIVGSDRLMAYDTYLASRFNSIPISAKVNASTNITDLDGSANPPDWRDTDATLYIIWPEYRKIDAEIQANMNNAHPDWTSIRFGIYFGSTSKNDGAYYASNNIVGLVIGDVRPLRYSEVASSTAVVQVKLRVGAGYGSAADPSFWADLSYVKATIEL